MKKILVTGGAGFIGSNFIRHILETRDYEIINIDKLTYAGNLANLQDKESDPRYTFIRADIAEKAVMTDVFAAHKPDGVINFAAETHVDRSIEDSSPFMKTNIIGTHTLLELSRQFNVKKYHQVSTDEVYGDLGDPVTGEPKTYFTETTPIAPNCPYAAAKASADLLVLSWHETYGMNNVITRCSNNYGPYQFPEKLIPFFLFRAMNNEPLGLYGDGMNIRDWLYVSDHCEAILTVFEKSPAGEVWNIGGHNEKTNIEIADFILDQTQSESEISFIGDRKAHDRRYAIDASKIERELGWKPAHTFEEALPKTIEWYLANRDWVEDCRRNV
jgi:dTDP-glucose 4,6-dehydratase